MTARLHLLDFVGGTPAPPRLHLLDFEGHSQKRARLRLLDFVGDTVITLAANAGPDITVDPGATFQLSGGASSGRPTRWLWELIGGTGPYTALSSWAVPNPTGVAPYTPHGCTLIYRLSVALDDEEYVASPDNVTVTVRAHGLFSKIGGVRVPVRLDQLARMVGLQ